MTDGAVSAEQQRRQADYIGRMAIELGRLAETVELPVLTYLLGMVAEEASLVRGDDRVISTPMPPSGGRVPRGRAGGAPT